MNIYDYRDGIAALDTSPESRQELEQEWLEDAISPPITPRVNKAKIEYRDNVKIIVNEVKKEDKKPAEKPRREWEEV